MKIEVVPETEDGEIDVEALERMVVLGQQPKLVAISHVATNSGAQLRHATPQAHRCSSLVKSGSCTLGLLRWCDIPHRPSDFCCRAVHGVRACSAQHHSFSKP